MLEQIFSAPVTLWLVVAVLVALIGEGLSKWNDPWAKPALTVYGTIGIWYPVDYLTSDSGDFHRFSEETLDLSFIQVALCLILLRMMIPPVFRRFARGLPLDNTWVSLEQRWIAAILSAAIVISALMFVVACVRLSESPDATAKILSFFWPPAYPVKVSMFGHGGIGDSTSFMWAALGYIQRLVYAIFGVIAVIGRGRIRYLAILMIALTWPYIFFDRMRNVMLSVLMPGLAAFWICTKHSIPVKVIASFLMLVALDYWFKVIAVYRADYGMSAFSATNDMREIKHQGLDMLKELCYINTFVADGTYSPNWGKRYFAEAVNIVPRAIWPGKPTIGIDYAIARGFGNNSAVGVGTSVSTGLIGQGVANFGRFFGVVAVAFLLSLWIGFLSRLWIQRRSAIRLFLFLIGLGVTFNSGRDITLLVLFPFVLGYIFVRIWEWYRPTRNNLSRQTHFYRKPEVHQPPT